MATVPTGFLYMNELIPFPSFQCQAGFLSPDRPFHNFWASLSGDGQILCSSETSIDGFWGYKIVEGSVGP